MHFDGIGLKDVLEWVMPLLLAWIGKSFFNIVRYMKSALGELTAAKDSVVELNRRMGEVIGILQNHDFRIQQVEMEITWFWQMQQTIPLVFWMIK